LIKPIKNLISIIEKKGIVVVSNIKEYEEFSKIR